MRSIRSRTVFLVLGLLGVSMTLLSLKSYVDAKHEIEELFDAQLAHGARLIAGMVGADMPSTARLALQQSLDTAVSAPRAETGGHRYESKLAFQVLEDDAGVLLQSASAPSGWVEVLVAGLTPANRNASADPSVFAGLRDSLPGYHDVTIDGHGWRLFMLRDRSDDRWILVGERDDVRGELVGSITLRSILPDVLGLPLIAVLVWLAIGWGLRPLQQMADLIRAREPEALSPLLIEPLPAELEPIVAALNRLLHQLNALLEREKRFLADAAHELRTPLAVLRIHAQNALESPDPADRSDALRHIEGSVERATRLVAQLLTLARLEPNAEALSVRDIDMHAFVVAELAELIPLALERGQELSLDADEDADHRVRGDTARLGILLQNLVGNAIQHTSDDGRIRVQLEARPREIALFIDDDGPGVPEAMQPRLFERFFRGGVGNGAGLGLSIVRRIVELHRGRIVLRDSPLGGLQVEVVLPR
ncbi:sensor histidine kinase [Rhodocyclaceae bacterium SMB388]